MTFDGSGSERPNVEGFREWKDAVGFPQEFPRLSEIDSPYVSGDGTVATQPLDPRIYLGRRRASALDNIVESLGMPLVAVCVEDGHGCSTLARIIHARAEHEAVGARVIPVHISLEDYVTAPVDQDAPASIAELPKAQARAVRKERARLADEVFAQLEAADPVDQIYAAIQRGLLMSLVTRPWERALGRAEYGSLIGAKRQDDETLEAQRTLLAGLIANNSAPGLHKHAPELARDVHELVRTLHDRRRIRISLQIDLSSTRWGRLHTRDGEELQDAFLRVVRRFAHALKNLDEQNARSEPPTLPSLIDQAIFISPAALSAFTNEWNRTPEVIEFPWYRPVDVFAILAHHYPPQHAAPGQRPTDRLSALLRSEELVEVDQSMAITTAIERMEGRLIESMADRDRITYHPDAAVARPAPLPQRLEHVERRLTVVETRVGVEPPEPDEPWAD